MTTTTVAAQAVTVTSGPDVYQFSGQDAVDFGGVTNLAFNTGSGSDTFDVQPSATTDISIDGGNPTLPTLPGDTVTLNLAGGATGAAQTVTGPSAGYWTFANRHNLTYSNIETTGATGGSSSLVFDMSSGFASGGPSDKITTELDPTGTLFEIFVNSVLAQVVAMAGLDSVQILGTSANDTLTVDASHGNPIPAGGLAFDGQGSGATPGTNGLILVGGTTSTYTSMTYTPSGPNSGTIALGTTGGPVDITYSHLTPILDTFAVPTTYNASAATPDTLDLIDQGVLPPILGSLPPGVTTTSQLKSAGGLFETVYFAQKPSVTLQGQGQVDTYNIDNPNPGTGVGAFYVNTGVGAGSIVNVKNSPLTVGVTGASANQLNVGDAGSLAGVTGGVNLTFVGGVSTDLTVDDSADGTSRTVGVTSSQLTFSGLSPSPLVTYAQTALHSLTVKGGASGNTFNVTGTPGNATTNVTTTLDTGTGADIVNVQATNGTNGAQLIVDGQNGADTVTIGSTAPAFSGTLNGIQGNVTVINGSGQSAITIANGGDSTGRTVNLTTVPSGADVYGQVKFSNAATISYRDKFAGVHNDTSSLVIYGGSGGNTFNVNNANDAAANFTTTLYLGPVTGGNVVNVRSTTTHNPLQINAQAGANTVNLGNNGTLSSTPGNVQSLNGPVSIASFSGSVALVVDDSTDSSAQTGVGISSTQITGLAPTPINYAAATLSSLAVYGGTHGNTFTVASTGSGYTTTLNSGTAADTVYVQTTTGPLTVHGQNGADTVMLGNTGTLGASPGNVQGLNGAVSIDNASGLTALSVDDSSDGTGRNVTLTNSQISGLAPANVNYANLSSLDIEGGSDADTFNVNSTANTSTTVNAGSGDDQFFITGGRWRIQQL